MADDMFGCSAFYSLNSFAFVIDFDAEQVFDMDIVFVLSGISSLSFYLIPIKSLLWLIKL